MSVQVTAEKLRGGLHSTLRGTTETATRQKLQLTQA